MVALGDATLRVPNVTLLVNFLDEPAILPSSLDDDSAASWNRFYHESIGHLVRATCDRIGRRKGISRAETIQRAETIHTYGLPLVLNVEEEKDACAHPEYDGMHGLFIAPDTFRQMPVRMPILTAGAPHLLPISSFHRPSTHGRPTDMLPGQTSRGRRKRNAVYWAGSTTGSHATANETSWRSSHRQRLVALAMDKEERDFTLLEEVLWFLSSVQV